VASESRKALSATPHDLPEGCCKIPRRRRRFWTTSAGQGHTVRAVAGAGRESSSTDDLLVGRPVDRCGVLDIRAQRRAWLPTRSSPAAKTNPALSADSVGASRSSRSMCWAATGVHSRSRKRPEEAPSPKAWKTLKSGSRAPSPPCCPPHTRRAAAEEALRRTPPLPAHRPHVGVGENPGGSQGKSEERAILIRDPSRLVPPRC
jgi:hypothetical protein